MHGIARNTGAVPTPFRVRPWDSCRPKDVPPAKWCPPGSWFPTGWLSSFHLIL